jgi:uncharacterized protein (TIGR02594 family)
MSTSKLPANAAHLANMPLPIWLKHAIAEIGTAEITGAKSNPRIMQYRKLAKIAIGGDDSVVPWCAIFINAMLGLSGVKGSGSAMARSFVSSVYFERLAEPMIGCITVTSSNRGPVSGHVFFYTGEDGLFYQGCGGNQNDSVNISMHQKKKLIGHFWPKGQPKPKAPYDQPCKLKRPLLPHERKASCGA